MTGVPWGMVFPQAGPEPRHPSQLYQFVGEGLLLFAVLWLFTRRPRPMGAASGLFLVGYGVCRFVAEYAREPDSFLGFLALGPDDGTVAVAADDRGRRDDDDLGVSARRQGAADRARPDEVATTCMRSSQATCVGAPRAVRRPRLTPAPRGQVESASRACESRRRARRAAALRPGCAACASNPTLSGSASSTSAIRSLITPGQQEQETRQHLAAAVEETRAA